jgi:ATP/maltotriose-dependent transcriptional regulator MalT
MSSADVDEAAGAGERAMQLADEFGDLPTRVHALITVATVQMEFNDRFAEGRANLQHAVELATRDSLHELVGRAYNNLAYQAFARYDLDLAESAVRAAVGYASAHGVDLWLRVALGSLAEVQLARGDWDGASESARQVLARPGTAVPRMGPLTVIGLIRARRGDPDPWGPLDDALDIAQGSGELQMLVPVAAARAEAAWLEGRPDAVLAESDAATRRAIAAGVAWALAYLAFWRKLAGAVDELPELRDTPRRLQLSGQPDLAALRWATLGYPYEAALALAETDTEPALREALTGLQQLGATAAASVVARRLRDRGARHIPRGPRPSTATNPAHLTRREVQVVVLIAAGLGNAEIAQRLFLSEKTVGHHVSAVLRKLGVTSRANAAAEAVRRGLVPEPK